ncbi:MAG: hypothetical protein WC635_08840 [Bacteriovorax sp.]|jgi:hypothetical protein
MKSNKLKILTVALFVFILLLGGLFYYASTKLRPEEIKRIAIEQTQKIFPNSEVSLQNVEIGWGLNFKINLQKFSILAVKENKKIEMISVDQLVVKIPVWAILTESGVIEVKMEAPLMSYHEFAPEGNNWTYAMGGAKSPEEKKAEEEKRQKEGEEKGQSTALGIFGKSKINVKLSDVLVKYSLRDNSKGELKLSRFLIKGLNFESSTAFEVASSAKFVMKDNSAVAFDTIAIGEFNIADLMRNGSVSSLVIIKINNISKTGLDWKFPEITTKVDLLLKKDGELSGKFATSFEAQNKISANFKMTKQIEINDFNAEIFLKDIAAIMGLDKSIDLSKAKLTSKGSVIYGEDKKINANINFSISPGIGYTKEGLTASTSVSGEFKGNDILVKAKTDAMDGQINTSVTGEFDPNEKFDMAKLKPFDIRIVASGMKVPEKFIRAKLWDKKSEEAKTVESAGKKVEAQVDSDGKDSAGLPPATINLEWSNLNIGGEDFSGRGKVVSSSNAIAIDNMNFKFSKGTGKITQTMTLGRHSNESKFNMEIANLNVSSFKAFLPPFIENFSGTFTGKFNGSAAIFKNNRPPMFDVNVVADAKNGEIKKLNISDYINPLLANIPMVKDKVKDKQFKIDGNFETLTMKGHFTNAQYSIASVDFVGINKKVQVTGSGDIYPLASSGKTSVMEVNFTDNTGKISDVLVKNVGTKVLPLRVSGPGFDLKPDYGYTISKLAKGALKTQGQEKIKEAVQKNIDKILPAAAKEKVKGLLDGFFKKK